MSISRTDWIAYTVAAVLWTACDLVVQMRITDHRPDVRHAIVSAVISTAVAAYLGNVWCRRVGENYVGFVLANAAVFLVRMVLTMYAVGTLNTGWLAS